MENPQRRTNGDRVGPFRIYRVFVQGESSYRLLLVCLGLLNAALLIAAVTMGIKCATVKQGSVQVSHSAATELINKLDYLRSSHSDVIEAEEEAKNQLQRAIKNHTLLKMRVEHQTAINDGYQKQIEAMRSEKALLQSNVSALEETCSRCPPGWMIFNSSCYFFSYNEAQRRSWKRSREDCVRRGADLVVVDYPEEMTFLKITMSLFEIHHERANVWIGLKYVQSEGAFVWLNNVTEVYSDSHWIGRRITEPQRENCGSFLYFWYSLLCSNALNWICEMQPS